MNRTAAATPGDPSVAKARSKNFTKEDQIALCHAWLDVSEDPVVGNDQGGADFWAKVSFAFNQALMDLGHEDRCREAGSIQIHWRDTLQKAVNKFCGSYSKAKQVEKSGYTEQDYIELALRIYSDSTPKQHQFKLLHCWHILRNKPKWTGCIAEKNTPVTKRTAAVLNESDAETPCAVRPAGTKKAKLGQSLKLNLTEAALELKREHSEKSLAEMRRKNELIEEMNAIDLFRGDNSEEAEEFRMLKRQQILLQARLKLAETKKKLE